jgi:hypothetical protein
MTKAHKKGSGLYCSASEVMRLEELRAKIRKGIESGEATPLDIGAIKARGRKGFAAEQK